jgi:hypothetical protein
MRLFSDRIDGITLQKTTFPKQPEKPYASINAIRYTLATLISDADAEILCGPFFGINYLRQADAHISSNDLTRAYKSSNIDTSKPFVIQAHDMLLAFVTTLVRVASIFEASISEVRK